MKRYWIGCGRTTCPDVAEILGVDVGAEEWQFSDGPVGVRGMSLDFNSLEAGIKALSPAVFIWDVENEQNKTGCAGTQIAG